MTGWHDIETAPKDGTSVLVWDGHNTIVAAWSHSFRDHLSYWRGQLGDVYKGVPIEDVGSWCAMASGDMAHDCGHDQQPVTVEPTHWARLPEPPKED